MKRSWIVRLRAGQPPTRAGHTLEKEPPKSTGPYCTQHGCTVLQYSVHVEDIDQLRFQANAENTIAINIPRTSSCGLCRRHYVYYVASETRRGPIAESRSSAIQPFHAFRGVPKVALLARVLGCARGGEMDHRRDRYRYDLLA